MADPPDDIRRFEMLQLASAFIGLIHGFATGAQSVFASIFGAFVTIALTLLVSRARKNWARWTLVVFVVFGVALIIWGIFVGLTQEALSKVYPAITALVWVMQAVALVLVFTPQSSSWLRSARSQA